LFLSCLPSSTLLFRASIAEQGRVLVFQRAVAVDPWTDLNLRLNALIIPAASLRTQLLILCGTLLAFALFALALRSLRLGGEEPTE
jgi:hypothetical protein